MNINLAGILTAIRQQYTLQWDGLHGISHWARVYENGLLLAESVPVNRDLVLLFALFHDACRINDGIDPGHGMRGAELASDMHGEYFHLPPEDFRLLYDACALHTRGLVQAEPIVQACWDADRLDLPRARIEPRPEKLCTAAAKDPQVIAWAMDRSRSDVFPSAIRSAWLTDSSFRSSL